MSCCSELWRSDCKDVAGAMQRAIPATLADGDVQRRLQALGILQASLIGGRSSKSTDTTLRYKILSWSDAAASDRPPKSTCLTGIGARETSTRSARRMIPPSASIFAQMTRRFYCRATHGLQPSVRRSMPLPRARTCRPVMYSICLFLEMECSEVSTLDS